MEKEIRSIHTSEMRARNETTIAGYAAVFNSPSVDMGFIESIRPGAFRDHLSDDVRFLWNHDSNLPLGRTKNGSLRLWEDERGLQFELTVPDTTWGRDALESVRSGIVDQMSFGFQTLEDFWGNTQDGKRTRELIRVRLIEVSAVTFPAYVDTAAAVRAQQDNALKLLELKQKQIDLLRSV